MSYPTTARPPATYECATCGEADPFRCECDVPSAHEGRPSGDVVRARWIGSRPFVSGREAELSALTAADRLGINPLRLARED